jgi:hypothetical protein
MNYVAIFAACIFTFVAYRVVRSMYIDTQWQREQAIKFAEQEAEYAAYTEDGPRYYIDHEGNRQIFNVCTQAEYEERQLQTALAIMDDEVEKQKHWGEVPDKDKLICPACRKDTGREIWYGLHNELLPGRAYGGCCILGDVSPDYRCLSCEHEWGVLENDDCEQVVLKAFNRA